MVEATIGGILLFGIGIALLVVAQTLRRNAMLDPVLVQSQNEINEAVAKSNTIKAEIAKLQTRLNESIEEMDRARTHIRAHESRLSRVTRGYRIVVEHGAPGPKSKRFDGSVFNRNANAMYSAVGATAVPTFFAHEVQIIIWADSLSDARAQFEKAYTAKDGYSSVFHGEIFGGRS